LGIYIDTLDGRATNRYFYRAAYVDGAHNRSALSLSSPPVYLPNVVPPRAPVITKVLGGDRQITLKWASNREADLLEYRVYRTDSKDNARDLRLMTLVHTEAVPSGDPAARPAEVEWTDKPLPGLVTFYYRVVALDDSGFLFSVGLEYQDDLEQGVLPEGLRQEFGRHGITLGNSATVTTDEAGELWRINDQDTSYIARREGDALNTYDSGNVSKPSPAVTGRAYDNSRPEPPTWNPAQPGELPDSVVLSWTAPNPNLRCLVQRFDDSAGVWRNVSSWLTPGVYTYIDDGRDPDGQYVYRLRVMDALGKTNIVYNELVA
jgi:hypothetical protein